MLHLSIFAGYEGPLDPGRSLHATLFAGSQVTRPPLARHLVTARRQVGIGTSFTHLFLTLFGGVEVLWPSLAEEYLALRDAVRASELTLAEWDRQAAQPDSQSALRMLSFTLFGSFTGNRLPSEDKELDDLTIQRHLGQIPEAAVQTLMLAIGQTGVARLAAVRQAVAQALNT
jgi:hypothetical protein